MPTEAKSDDIIGNNVICEAIDGDNREYLCKSDDLLPSIGNTKSTTMKPKLSVKLKRSVVILSDIEVMKD